MQYKKTNVVQTSIAPNQYDELLKIFKLHGHDLAYESFAQVMRVEMVYPYLRKGMREMNEQNG